MKTKIRKGLSLIEVLVVVAIVALLVIAGIQIFTRQIAKGNDARRKSDMDRIKIAIEEYEKDNNCYPNAELMDNCGWDESIPIHPYLSNVPCDPVTKEPYSYEPDGNTCSKWFRLYTILQNVSDVNIISGIGPDDKYNYYISSQNAPVLETTTRTTSPTPTPSYVEIPVYGCISGICQRIYYDSDSNPACQPNYDSSNCYNQCGTPVNPASECR